ncbi:MAG: glycerophosphodiester phosphodiesterase [Chloroflexi bacterium]|nr:glycerophosphodiester phosphodiesterase [Chloroflexota bacterium]
MLFYTSRPLIFGHRGAPEMAPENTLAAFEAARQMGADGVELDTLLTADGVPVVCHNLTVDKTTNGAGRIRDLTVKQIKTLDAGSWFHSSFTGERIPTLQEVLEWAGDDMLLNIELKSLSLRDEGLERAVLHLMYQYELTERVIISSFNPFAIRRVKMLDPGIQTGLLYAPALPMPLRRAWLRPLAHPNALHPHHTMVSPDYLQWARNRGYRVNTWTVNEPAEMRRLTRLGVDIIITNQPDVLHKVLSGKEDE